MVIWGDHFPESALLKNAVTAASCQEDGSFACSPMLLQSVVAHLHVADVLQQIAFSTSSLHGQAPSFSLRRKREAATNHRTVVCQ